MVGLRITISKRGRRNTLLKSGTLTSLLIERSAYYTTQPASIASRCIWEGLDSWVGGSLLFYGGFDCSLFVS
jgi:hypothetical protein